MSSSLILHTSSILALLAPTLQGEISYALEVQPILSQNCFACHGTDLKHREGDLSLHSFEEATRTGAVVPFKPDESEIMKRIVSRDPDDVMPPPKSHKKPLPPEQVAILRQWIQEGATYEKHWSFNTVDKPEVEKPADGWGRNGIDSFVHAKLKTIGLEPNPESEPYRLIRRLSFDLTGLPPSPALVDRFLSDPTDEQYLKIVDELLNSTSYAEHQTRHWMDAVRYADTHGIHFDNERSIWPYRDWLIRAFQQNMPYDRFTIEQIAGDLLENPTQDQLIATGYNRCLPTTNEGGIIDAEYDVLYANDRVATTMGIWQGLTAECAACHDHKFDPLSQKEYYQLTAYFRNNTMPVRDGNRQEHKPYLHVHDEKSQTHLKHLRSKSKDLRHQIDHQLKAAKSDYQQWLQFTGSAPLPESLQYGLKAHIPFTTGRTATDLISKKSVKGSAYEPEALYAKSIQLDKRNAISLPAKEVQPALKGSFSFGGLLWAKYDLRGTIWSKMDANKNQRGWRVRADEYDFTVEFIDEWPKKALRLRIPYDLTDENWHHLFVTYDAAATIPVTIYLNGRPVDYTLDHHTLSAAHQLITDAPLQFGRRHSKRRNKADHINHPLRLGDFRFYDHALHTNEVRSLISQVLQETQKFRPTTKWKPHQKDFFQRIFLAQHLPGAYSLLSESKRATQVADDFYRSGPITLIMEERKNSTPKAHVLNRGDYASPTEEVDAAIPDFLPSLPSGQPNNRLGFARWLMSTDNPLTARVTANRYWHYLFGRGIVKTTEDFGVSGELPTHPKLLDWLAVEFMESGWDLHHLLRTIVTSSTYRQSQTMNSLKREKDPENAFLSRGPRYRLDGEQLRDMALLNSKLLVPKIGGPPVKPYQPENVWKDVAMTSSNTKLYRPDTGEGLYRRSLYTFWKRTAAPPSMTILNAPDRDVFCVRRELTNTPLQAFVLMNDPQYVEACRRTGEEIMATSSDFAEKINQVGQLYLSRTFQAEELAALEDTFRFARDEFRRQPDRAKSLITVGVSKPQEDLAPADLAAWTLVISQVLNLDETLTK